MKGTDIILKYLMPATFATVVITFTYIPTDAMAILMFGSAIIFGAVWYNANKHKDLLETPGAVKKCS